LNANSRIFESPSTSQDTESALPADGKSFQSENNSGSFVTIETPNTTLRPSQIRAVIMDYGEVLCLLPSSQDVDRIAKIFRMNPQSFLPIYMKSRMLYDRGDVSPAEYWDNFAAQAGVKIDAVALEDIRRLDIEMWCRHNERMIRWVEQIHSAGYKTAILSNMHLDLSTHLRKNFSWIGHFDHHIFSAEARSVKPEPAIYQRTIEALGVKPAEALFIDDRDENLKEARVAGIRTIRFQSIPKLREDLQSLGFTILPG